VGRYLGGGVDQPQGLGDGGMYSQVPPQQPNPGDVPEMRNYPVGVPFQYGRGYWVKQPNGQWVPA
jgi:hypothetical protein